VGAIPAPPKGGVKALKIAFFSLGTSNTYLVKAQDGVVSEAQKYGLSVHIYEANFNAVTQYDQLATALSSGSYNAFIIDPVSGQPICSEIKQAISKHILVVTAILPACSLYTLNGVAQWEPGEVANVGGQTPDWWDGFFQYIAAQNPNGGKVIILTGPTADSLTAQTDTAAKKELPASKFTIVSNQATDYTTADGYKVAYAALEANPSANILISNYSGVTLGVVSAAKALGRLSSLKIYDAGGTTQIMDLVKAGEVQASYILLPYREATESVKALVDYVEGKPVPKFINPYTSSDPVLPHGQLWITKANVDQFLADSAVAY
jgi:ribose transport system substrate-binding protein